MTKLLLLTSYLVALGLVLAVASADSSSSKSSSSSSNSATQARQSPATVLGTLSSLVPGLITSVAPLVLLFGLGALMMPALSMGLLRESRRSSNDQAAVGAGPNMAFQNAFSQYARPLQTSPQDIYYFTKRSFPSLMSQVNTAGFARGFQDLFERVLRAIENADKRYS